MFEGRDQIQDAQHYLTRAYLITLDRTHGLHAMADLRRSLRPCVTLDQMELAEQRFSRVLTIWTRERKPKAACETLEAVMLLVRCAIMAEWHSAVDFLDEDCAKAGANLDAARLALVQRCLGFRWFRQESAIRQ